MSFYLLFWQFAHGNLVSTIKLVDDECLWFIEKMVVPNCWTPPPRRPLKGDDIYPTNTHYLRCICGWLIIKAAKTQWCQHFPNGLVILDTMVYNWNAPPGSHRSKSKKNQMTTGTLMLWWPGSTFFTAVLFVLESWIMESWFLWKLTKKTTGCLHQANGWFGRGFCWFWFCFQVMIPEDPYIQCANLVLHMNLTRCVHSGLSRLAKSNRRIQRKTESPSWY